MHIASLDRRREFAMNLAPKILVVDDGSRYVELFHALMQDYRYATRCELAGPCWACPHRAGCTLTHAHDWNETEQALLRHPDIDVVLLDLTFQLPEARLLPAEGALDMRQQSEGLRILKRIRAMRRSLPVVLMTSRQDVDLQFGQLGTTADVDEVDVDEYVTFAGENVFDTQALRLLIEGVRLRAGGEVGEREPTSRYIWGSSLAMAKVRRRASALSRTSLPVLLLGETGTGKSALAIEVLHREGLFVAVDLSTIPENLMAAELFGAAAGAFSGAVHRAGRFEEADGGTLFLDEIGNLPPAAQRMLLLALQDGQVTRLGETKPRAVSVKLVAATNADLRTLVAEGRFRADLYARLNPAARLEMPPLRDRMGDLQSLVTHFVRRCFAGGVDRQLLLDYAEACGLGAGSDLPPTVRLRFGGPDGEAPQPRELVFTISRRSTERLMAHRWSGNVRELELFVANALLMTLVDATAAAEAGRAGDAPQQLPVPDRLVGELLEGARLPISDFRRASKPPPTSTRHKQAHGASDGESAPSVLGDRWSGLLAEVAAVRPGEKLRNVAQTLERAYLKDLFRLTGGDLELMAQRLLQGDPKENARRIRTRFQQLGLRIRALRNDADNIKDDAFGIGDASG